MSVPRTRDPFTDLLQIHAKVRNHKKQDHAQSVLRFFFRRNDSCVPRRLNAPNGSTGKYIRTCCLQKRTSQTILSLTGLRQ
jgi:hypothetical protein